MAQLATATSIPDKIFFKIGEVCDLVGVQAHVLRYWETEFSQLSPQKNRSGQRTYRRRDVEIALRIKELLYDELFTIAGAKKKLVNELRETTRLKIVQPEPLEEAKTFIQPIPNIVSQSKGHETSNFDDDFDEHFEMEEAGNGQEFHFENKPAVKTFVAHLLEIKQIIEASKAEDELFLKRKQ